MPPAWRHRWPSQIQADSDPKLKLLRELLVIERIASKFLPANRPEVSRPPMPTTSIWMFATIAADACSDLDHEVPAGRRGKRRRGNAPTELARSMSR